MSHVTRFAPSPNGYLHLGHAYSALFAAEAAGKDGRFLLRIEDIDAGRARPEFEAAILEDLAWLGLTWETPVRRQSKHFEDYWTALDRLQGLDATYPCFCTRRDIQDAGAAPHGPEGVAYPGTCRGLTASEIAAHRAAGRPHAVRLNLKTALDRTGPASFVESGTPLVGNAGAITASAGALHRTLGDVVIARKDVPTSYHLAVTVDDALQGITLVTRGQDLFFATPIHRLLQELLDLPQPEYRHHRLITDDAGGRMAKREGSRTLRDYRAEGLPAEEVRALIGY